MSQPVISKIGMHGQWKMECRDKNENIKWTEEWENLVVDEGLNYLLGSALNNEAPKISWFIGLTDGNPSPGTGDTAANIGSLAWNEVTQYQLGTRPPFITTGNVSGRSLDNIGNEANYTIDQTVIIGGAFLVSSAVKGPNNGEILYSVGAFVQGNKELNADDTLKVTATFTVEDKP
jgi:hypothetical protein